jgi:metallo-beta-lactamase class B
MLTRMRQAARIVAAASLLMIGSMAVMLPAWAASGSTGKCAECVKPHKPFRIFGNTYYVGTEGLSSILITSDFGHVLVDAGLPESAPLIKASIEALGFKVTDVKGILLSGEHPEYAGGVAQLQRDSGAQVYTMRGGEPVLRTGKLSPEDPLFASKATIAPVPQPWVIQDDQLLGIGSQRVRATATPGRSPGGASWGWESCEGGSCLNFFYVGNLVAAAAGKYRFKDHPDVQEAFEGTFKRLESARCDVLLTAHPEASLLFKRLDPEGGSRAASIKDDAACKRHAQSAREAFAKYLAAGK